MLYDSFTPEGKLPKDFILSIEAPKPNKLQFTPGAKDGIGMFTFRSAPRKRAAKKIVKLLKHDWKKHADSQAEIAILLRTCNAFSILELVLSLLRDDLQNLSMEQIKAYACRLAFESIDEDLVKLGIALLGLLDLTYEEDIIDKLLVLALYSEFTFYATLVLGRTRNGNDLLFAIAQKAEGWGKIHAVGRLEPRSEEIREWILRHGCENSIVDSYLAWTCATKGNLIGALRRDVLDDALFDSISILIAALLDADLVAGLESYEHGKEALLRYLQFADKQAVTAAHLWHIMTVLLFLDTSGLAKAEELRALCERIIDQSAWRDLIFKTLEDPDNEQFLLAANAAVRLKLDIANPVFEAILQDPIQHSGYLHFLYGNPEYLSQLVDLYETILPLDELATGMGDYLFADTLRQEHLCLDSILFGLRDYPGMGERLVQTALRSPVVRERYGACQVLQSWEDLMGESLEELWPETFSLLTGIAPREVNFETKAEMRKLLGKRALVSPGAYKRFLLIIPQILLVAATLFAFFRLWHSGDVHFIGADTALAALEGYLAWHREIFHLSVVAVLVVLIGNMLIIWFGRAKWLLAMKHLAFALAGVVLILVVVIIVSVSTPTREVQDDIRAIAWDEEYDPTLSWTDPERLARTWFQTHMDMPLIRTEVVRIRPGQNLLFTHLPAPPSVIHPPVMPWVVHRVLLEEAPYVIYFPRVFIRELELLLQDRTEDAQAVEVRYTPNLRLVLEVRLME